MILIALFLSVRLGRGDDREEQPIRHGDRGRGRRDANDPRWQDRDSRDTRRPPSSARPSRSPGQRARAGIEQAGRYRDRDERRSERDQGVRARDYDRPQRRPERYETGPGAASASRRPVAAAAPRAGSSRDSASRRSAGNGRDRHDGGQSLYDTGPVQRTPADDFPSGPFPADDYPSDAFASGPLPVADYPSGGFPSGPLPAADFPSAEYPAADYPSGGFRSGPLPAADFPSGDQPATRARGRSASPKAEPDRERPDSRRKQAKAQNPPKGRSRPQRGKRDDDDEWPSMEWDKLSDEQYWAELSSDKPLASPKPASPKPDTEAKPAPAKNGQSRSATGKPSLSQPAPAPAAATASGRDLPSRKAPSPQREAVTERLPVRGRQQTAADVSRPSSSAPAAGGRRAASSAHPQHEPTIAMLASLAGTPAARPPGALDDDPLTSPSFAVPAVDSRSYSSARKNVQTGATGPHPAGGNHAAAGYDYGSGDSPGSLPASGGYSTPHFADPGYSYQAPLPPAADWSSTPAHGTPVHGTPAHGTPVHGTPAHGTPVHGTPAHGTPVHGNPYGSYVDSAPPAYPATPQPGYADAYPGTGYQSYPSLSEPSGYPEPAYEPATEAPYQGFPAAALPAPPADPGQYPPQHAGYPTDDGYGAEHAGPAGYPDAYGNPGYPPGYPADYVADPYGHDGYGGYSAAQG